MCWSDSLELSLRLRKLAKLSGQGGQACLLRKLELLDMSGCYRLNGHITDCVLSQQLICCYSVSAVYCETQVCTFLCCKLAAEVSMNSAKRSAFDLSLAQYTSPLNRIQNLTSWNFVVACFANDCDAWRLLFFRMSHNVLISFLTFYKQRLCALCCV